ncbi:hypothetical protein EZV62_027554 [Acer yangbiense]|uniref:RNase H type-1 domain-containing protein n=1 Tax=Acer yangbiense TaxID=1000413 RepID=A0A5C7GUI2_9ROSI|nr:hypothetical protein EZV62_027554 [Acer yangbiense]
MDFELLCVVWWRIWYKRNQFVHSNEIPNDIEVLEWAWSYLHDYRVAFARDNPKLTKEREPPKWKPPDRGVFKINTDAALNENDFQFGISVVIRNYQGHVMASLCQIIKASYQPQIIEAMAILKGIWLAVSLGLLPASLELNALTVVNMVEGANSVAHALSKLALTYEDEYVWLEDCPLSVESLVLGDCLSSL